MRYAIVVLCVGLAGCAALGERAQIEPLKGRDLSADQTECRQIATAAATRERPQGGGERALRWGTWMGHLASVVAPITGVIASAVWLALPSERTFNREVAEWQYVSCLRARGYGVRD